MRRGGLAAVGLAAAAATGWAAAGCIFIENFAYESKPSPGTGGSGAMAAGGGGAGASGAGGSGGSDAGAGGTGGTANCGGEMVTLTTNPLHCGACNHVCEGEDKECIGGYCKPDVVDVPGATKMYAVAFNSVGEGYVAAADANNNFIERFPPDSQRIHETGPGKENKITEIAPTDGTLTYFVADGMLHSVAHGMTASPPLRNASVLRFAPCPYSPTAAMPSVFYFGDNQGWRLEVGAAVGTAVMLGDQAGPQVAQFAIGNHCDDVYWTADGVQWVRGSGAAPIQVASAESPTGIALDDMHVYWLGSKGDVRRAARGDLMQGFPPGSPEDLLPVEPVASNLVGTLEVDDDYVYRFFDDRVTRADKINGSNALDLYSGQIIMGTVHDGWVYVADGTQLLKLK